MLAEGLVVVLVIVLFDTVIIALCKQLQKLNIRLNKSAKDK